MTVAVSHVQVNNGRTLVRVPINLNIAAVVVYRLADRDIGQAPTRIEDQVIEKGSLAMLPTCLPEGFVVARELLFGTRIQDIERTKDIGSIGSQLGSKDQLYYSVSNRGIKLH